MIYVPLEQGAQLKHRKWDITDSQHKSRTFTLKSILNKFKFKFIWTFIYMERI